MYSVSAVAAAGAGAGAASHLLAPSTYPLAHPVVILCCEYVGGDPVAQCGLWETMQEAAVSVEARVGYCFGTYVTRRLQNREGLTELSRWKFVVEVAAYATRRADFPLLDRALATVVQSSAPETRLCVLNREAGTPGYCPFARDAIDLCQRRGLAQLGFLKGGQKVLAFERFLALNSAPANQERQSEERALTTSVAVRHLEDASFVTSLLSSTPSLFEGDDYVYFMWTMSVAAACRGLPAFAIPQNPKNPNARMPENVQKGVNEILGTAPLSLTARLGRIEAIFQPCLSRPLCLSDLYEHFPILQALLKEKNALIDVVRLLEAIAKNPRLEMVKTVVTYPAFLTFHSFSSAVSLHQQAFSAATRQDEWESVALLIQQAKKMLHSPINLPIFLEALNRAIARGNAEAVAILMTQEHFVSMQLEAVCGLTRAALETDYVDTTSLLFQSPQMQRASVEEFATFFLSVGLGRLLRVSSPVIQKMFLEDPRWNQLNSRRLMTVILPFTEYKSSLSIFKLLTKHPVFNRLNIEHLGVIFESLQTVEHLDVLKATGRVDELEIKVFDSAMRRNIWIGDVDFSQALFLTPQFSQLEVGQLNAHYRTIARRGPPPLLAAFMASSRFKDVDAITLGKQLVDAVRMRDVEHVKLMVASPRLRTISAEFRTDALLEAEKLGNGKEAMVALLTLLVPS